MEPRDIRYYRTVAFVVFFGTLLETWVLIASWPRDNVFSGYSGLYMAISAAIFGCLRWVSPHPDDALLSGYGTVLCLGCTLIGAWKMEKTGFNTIVSSLRLFCYARGASATLRKANEQHMLEHEHAPRNHVD